MAKKKMCKWYHINSWGHSICAVPNKNTNYTKCPRYSNPESVNSRCEIIPAKKKDKVVRAWVRFALINGRVLADSGHKRDSKYPCTITIKADVWAKLRREK